MNPFLCFSPMTDDDPVAKFSLETNKMKLFFSHNRLQTDACFTKKKKKSIQKALGRMKFLLHLVNEYNSCMVSISFVIVNGSNDT